MTAFAFWELGMVWALLWGNAYAEIEWSNAGEPLALWPIHPGAMRVARDTAGRRVYVVRVGGDDVPLAADSVLHIAGMSLDGLAGMPITVARDSLGLAKAQDTFAASFFKNGAAPSGVLSHPGKLGPAGRERLREGFEAHTAGLTNAQRLLVLEEGMTFTARGIAPENAQLLESRRFSVLDVARLFLIPPHMLAELESGASFASVEAKATDFTNYCVAPWTVKISQEINYKLFGEDDQHFAEFMLAGLLRGDSKSRAEYYRAMREMGALSVNEIRASENMNNIGPEGDTRIQPLNFTLLGQPAETPTGE
jgi:HK97 family phage portal protein